MMKAADIYGSSLYELAVSENAAEEICGEAEQVRKLFAENPDYVRLLSEPSIHLQDRQKLADEAFGGQIHPYLLNFMKLLMEKGLLGEFPACCRVLRHSWNRDNNIAEAVVTSAVALSPEQAEQLRTKLEKLSGKSVQMVQKVDPSVLGGIRVEIDGKLLDGTVDSRLKELRSRMENTVL